MSQELFAQYAEKKIAAKKLAADIKEIEFQIKQFMQDENADSVKTSFGSFSISVRRTYMFSPQVEEIRVSLKEAEQDEIMRSVAFLKSESKVLTFRPKK